MKPTSMKLVRAACLLAFLAGCLLLAGCSLWRDVSGGFVAHGASEEKRIESFVGSLKLRNGDPESMYRLAVHYQKTGRHDWAIEEFRNILAVEPAFARAYNGIGVSLDHYRKYALAQKAYTKALEIDPKLDCAWNNLGYSVLLQGRPAQAAVFFEKALALRQDNPRYMNNLALAKGRMEGRDLVPADVLADLPRPPGDPQGRGWKEITPPEQDGASEAVPGGDKGGALVAPAIRAGRPEDRAVARDRIIPAEVQQPKSRRVVVQPFRAMAGEVTFTVTPVIPMRYGNSQSMQATETFSRGPSVATGRTATLSGFQAAAMLVNTETFDRALHHSDGPYIEIANGNGVTGMAATVKRYLVGKGFPVLRASNAAHFGFRSTKVLYRAGSLQQAWRIAKEIPGEQNFEKVDDLNSETIAIKVILGKDIQPYFRHFKDRS